MRLIERALNEAGVAREGIDCVAVSLGPGSYTGIRGAIAIAQGWQLARPVRLIGISSIESLAAQAQALGIFGTVGFASDAQRNELYFATYTISAAGYAGIHALQIVAAEEAKRLLAEASEQSGLDPNSSRRPARVAGPEVSRWFPEGVELFPKAGTVALLASRRCGSVPGEKLEPIYLRETSFVKAPPARIVPPA